MHIQYIIGQFNIFQIGLGWPNQVSASFGNSPLSAFSGYLPCDRSLSPRHYSHQHVPKPSLQKLLLCAPVLRHMTQPSQIPKREGKNMAVFLTSIHGTYTYHILPRAQILTELRFHEKAPPSVYNGFTLAGMGKTLGNSNQMYWAHWIQSPTPFSFFFLITIPETFSYTGLKGEKPVRSCLRSTWF